MMLFGGRYCFGLVSVRIRCICETALIETVPLSTYNMLWLGNKKIIFCYALLSGGLSLIRARTFAT